MSTFPASARNGCQKKEDRGAAFFQINLRWLRVSNLMSISFYHPTTGWLFPSLRMGSISFLHSLFRLFQIARRSPLCLFSLRVKKKKPVPSTFLNSINMLRSTRASPTCLYASRPDFWTPDDLLFVSFPLLWSSLHPLKAWSFNSLPFWS